VVNFRRFNGTSDVVTLSLGTAINTITFGTIAVLCRRTDNNNWNGPFCTRSSGLDAEMYLDIAPSSASPANVLWSSYGASQNNNNAFTVASADDWVWIVITKATGNVAPRYHKYVMSTQTWTRGNGTGNIGDATSPSGGSLQIGNVAGDFFKGDIAAVAVWTTALSDATLNNIPNNWTSGVLAASPQAAWLLNQASTGTSISDAVGTANQTALSGTSVQSGTIANWAETSSTTVSGTDTAAGAETASVALASAETASSTDSASSTAMLAGTDALSGTESGQIALSGTDAGASADTSALAATATGSDTASGTDAGSVPQDQAVSGADVAASAESGFIALRDDDIGQSRNADDTSAGTETATITFRTQATNESFATAVESGSVVILGQTVSGVDTAGAAETGLVNVAASSTDTAAGAETATLRVIGSVRKPGTVRLLNGKGVAQITPGGKATLVLLSGRVEEA
jgi:hypothetical protein